MNRRQIRRERAYMLDPLSQQSTVGLADPIKRAHERVTGSNPARGRLQLCPAEAEPKMTRDIALGSFFYSLRFCVVPRMLTVGEGNRTSTRARDVLVC